MEGRDRSVVMVGVVCVLISVSIGTAFALGPSGPLPSPMDEYVAEWYTQTGTWTLDGNNDGVFGVDVREHNLTIVTVGLTWEDDEFFNPIGQRDDTLTIRLEGPAGVSVDDQVSGTSGDLELRFDLADVPTDPEAGNIGDYLDENATGEWSVTVSVQAAGLRDTGNSWSISLSYTYYMGRLIDNPEVV